MSWRNVRFGYLHAARDVGIASVTADATVSTDYPAENLIDDRASVRMKWTNAAANHQVDIDLGSGFVTGLDRIYIPNHNCTGSYQVQEDDNAPFASPDPLQGGTAMTAGTDVDDELLTSASSQQYIRFTITTSGAWELGQLWFSKLITLTAVPEAGWVDEYIPNVDQLPSGDSIQHDPPQRHFEFTWRAAGAEAAADRTNLLALVAAVSTHDPFLVWPPYDTEAVRVMKLDSARIRDNTLVPNSSDRTSEIVLSMTDYLG